MNQQALTSAAMGVAAFLLAALAAVGGFLLAHELDFAGRQETTQYIAPFEQQMPNADVQWVSTEIERRV